MSVILSESLTDFLKNHTVKTCKSLQFSSGTIYEGPTKDNRACGYGKFIWKDNETFEGFFSNGVRMKIGIQKWSDGDEYKGEFFNDRRHGWGLYRWWNFDVYEGSFFEDSRHGYGQYSCNDGGSYEGTFYRDRREGFGRLQYANGDCFQGLYKDNYRCGPGILQYKNGCQDIGLWHRGSLLKLIVSTEDVFRISQFSDLVEKYPNKDSDSTNSLKTSKTKGEEYPLDSFLTYKLTKPKSLEIFNEKLENSDVFNLQVEKTILSFKKEPSSKSILEDQEEAIIDETTKSGSTLQEMEISIEDVDAEEIFDSHKVKERQEPITVVESFQEFLSNLPTPSSNNSTMLKLLDHLKRFANYIPKELQSGFKFDMSEVVKDVVTNIFEVSEPKLMVDRKAKYGQAGDFERNSEQIISSSHTGNIEEIKQLFTNKVVPNANVTDCRGSFSLLEASLTWNTELINYLLDCGADINQITDDGVSALGSCFLFYYPQKYFIETIAESCVLLNYTPMNFSGVRREPVKNPNIVSSRDNSQIEKTETVDTLQETIFEQWNAYQTSLVQMDTANNKDQSLKGNARELQKNKWKDDKSYDFDSYRNNIEYPTKIVPKLLEKAASVLSNNNIMIQRQPRSNSRNQDLATDEGTARFKALQISRQNQMLQVILLLLRRGADPNACTIPFPSIFFSVKSGDIEMTKVLLSKDANVNARLGSKNLSLTPLHIACCLPGKKGIIITELLLKNGADPNGRALVDESFLDVTLADEWSKDPITDEQNNLLGGKTPFHLVCSRYDDFKICHDIVVLLLKHGGDPNLICNGHTPLTLAIATGNDLVVDELLTSEKLNINQPLTHGLGNALCVASSTAFEHSRPIEGRVALIKKLITFGADMLSPVPIGFKRTPGSSVDFAYYVFFLDQRVSRLPYHALTSIERDLFNNRKNILSYMGMFTRECAVEKEKQRLESLKIDGIQSRGPSPGFVWSGAGANPEDQKPITTALSKISHNLSDLDFQMQGSDLLARKPLFKYCYECGRSVNVKLTACTRCKEVFFCSKLCKTKAWNTRHKFECLRVGGRISSAGNESKGKRNTDSPTPTTMVEDPILTKPKSDIVKETSTKIRKSPSKDDTDAVPKSNQVYRKLPPLDSSTHPSYSYAYIMGNYVKVDSYGKTIVLGDTLIDNYSFE